MNEQNLALLTNKTNKDNDFKICEFTSFSENVSQQKLIKIELILGHILYEYQKKDLFLPLQGISRFLCNQNFDVNIK